MVQVVPDIARQTRKKVNGFATSYEYHYVAIVVNFHSIHETQPLFPSLLCYLRDVKSNTVHFDVTPVEMTQISYFPRVQDASLKLEALNWIHPSHLRYN